MKIIQVQTQAEAAGAQRISDMVGEGLRRRGHDVRTVFMYRKTAAYDADPHADFVVDQPPRGLIGQVGAALGLFRYLRRERPDAVLSYQHFGSVFGTLGGRLAGARHLIANQSGAPLSGGARGIATVLDRMMGTLGIYHYSVVNSAWTDAQFASYPAGYRDRVRRIDHGVTGPARRYDRLAARAAFALPQDARLIVTSGRLSDSKNQVVLPAALALLPPDVHLAIAGAGPCREALLAAAREHGVEARMHLVGEVAPDRIFEFLAGGDVYAFPSVLETFGLAVVEAAISGLPIVCSDIEVMREVLTNAEGAHAALFVPPRDAREIAVAISKVLDDPALAVGLAAAGSGLAQKYAPERMVAAYEALLA